MMNIDADGPILMLKLLRAVYWFDEGLSRSRNASGVRSFSRSHSLVILNVVLGMQKPYQLADAIGISRQAVSRLIADLVEAGVLMVNPDPNDGRGTILSLILNPRRTCATDWNWCGFSNKGWVRSLETTGSGCSALHSRWIGGSRRM